MVRGWLVAALLTFILIGGALSAPRAASPAAPAAEAINREFRECAVCPEMVAVPGGSFTMGSPPTERGRFDAEGPQHAVTVRAFAIGKFVVTNAEFSTFLLDTGYQPPACNTTLHLGWKSPGNGLVYTPGMVESPLWPATCLNWSDAQAYISWLNTKVRAGPPTSAARAGPYRLPSEAEWEYAVRAGTSTARWWGDAIGVGQANCNGCGSKWDGSLLAPVGSFPANPFGIHDALGNVWQWVNDCWNDSYVGAPRDGSSWSTGNCSKRVLRGGSWSNIPVFVRSATRAGADAEGQDFDYSINAGFRVARTLP